MSDVHIEVELTIRTSAAIAEKLGDNDIERAINRGLDTIGLQAEDIDVDWYPGDEEPDTEAVERPAATVTDLTTHRMIKEGRP